MVNLFTPLTFIVFLVSIAPTVLFPMMIKSQTDCTATSKKFQYNCNVLFFHKKEPMSGYSGIVGAKMPSMAMAHNVKPVKFFEKEGVAGHYEFTIQLDPLLTIKKTSIPIINTRGMIIKTFFNKTI